MFLRQKSNYLLFIIAFVLLSMVACGSSVGNVYETGGSDDYLFRSEPASAPMEIEMEMATFEEGMVVQDMAMSFTQGDGGSFADESLSANQERIVIKNGDITITVEDPTKSILDISEMAENMDGFVVYSNIYQTQLENGEKVPQGNVTIRVPAERFSEALQIIENSANQVISRNQSGQDVTREYTDLNSRLINLENTELQLREIMEAATETEDVLLVYNELSRIRGEIEFVKGQIQYFQQAAALSAISVTLLADEAVQPITIGGWEPAGVAKAAIQTLINTLQRFADTIIWLLLFLFPIMLVFAIPVWYLLRAYKNRTNNAKLQKKIEAVAKPKKSKL